MGNLFKKPSFLLGMAVLCFGLMGFSVAGPSLLSTVFVTKKPTVVSAANLSLTPTGVMVAARIVTPTFTSTATATRTATPTKTPSPILTQTQPPPTPTASATMAPTQTRVPTTIVKVNTSTPVPDSPTAVPTQVVLRAVTTGGKMPAPVPPAAAASSASPPVTVTQSSRIKTVDDYLFFELQPGDCWLVFNSVDDFAYNGSGSLLWQCTMVYSGPGVIMTDVVSRQNRLKFSGVQQESEGRIFYQVIPVDNSRAGVYWVAKY